MRETISRLLLQIDEAWIDHMERMKDRAHVSTADLQLEELLFTAEAWLDRAQAELRDTPLTSLPAPLAPARHKA